MSTETHTHDVVVIGARCAGAATARLLALQGYDVVLLDRSEPGSDTLSTHGLARGGVVQLQRWGLLDDVLSAGWIDIPMAPGQKAGRAGMKGAMDGYFQSFPDFNVVNQDMIAEGDKVVVRSEIHATQSGAFAGVAPSNRPFTIMAIDIHQICDGRVVKTWHVEDWLNGLFQMGALPPSHGSK